jgi:phasin family protein
VKANNTAPVKKLGEEAMFNQNQYFENLKNFMDPANYSQFTKMNNMPEMGNMMNACKKCNEAFAQASKTGAENVQAMMRRNAEIAQQNVSNIFNGMKDISSVNNPEQAMNKQKEIMQRNIENSLNNLRELAEMSNKSSMEVFDLVGKGLKESLETAQNENEAASSKSKKKESQ